MVLRRPSVADTPPPTGSVSEGGGEHRYLIREKLVSIGDDYWIENERGQRVFKVDGKALRVRDTLKIRNIQGEEVYEIKGKLLTVRKTMEIARHGKTVATVKKALIDPLRGRFSVELAGGADMRIQGDIVAHEYKIEQGGRAIAEISRRWFRLSDTYGVDIQPGQDDALILAITVVVDQMTHDVH